ncbi:hypothetical protein ABT354_36710 [Streptomyces sp. NPDC000594]|uniref:hypothetical protein n=1 Tax=Streptomyces sp. NPDC000594 TaxID=3154261 RepID=UPI00332F7E64
MTTSMRDPLERAEEELRTLLERGAPRNAAPDGRLAQIRTRVVRRRQRRAGAAVLGAVALAVVGMLVPQSLRDEPRALPPAAPPPLMPPQEHDVRFLDQRGLTVSVPVGWHTLEIGEDYQPLSLSGGFISTQPLTARPPSCAPVDEGPCPALDRLGPRDVVIRVSGVKAVAEGWNTQPLQRQRLTDGWCEQVGGAATYVRTFAVARKQGDVAAVVSVCAGENLSSATLGSARTVVDSLRFDAGKAGTAGSTATAPQAVVPGKRTTVVAEKEPGSGSWGSGS